MEKEGTPVLYEHLGIGIAVLFFSFIAWWLVIVLFNGIYFTWFYEKPLIDTLRCSDFFIAPEHWNKWTELQQVKFKVDMQIKLIDCLKKEMSDFNQ